MCIESLHYAYVHMCTSSVSGKDISLVMTDSPKSVHCREVHCAGMCAHIVFVVVDLDGVMVPPSTAG